MRVVMESVEEMKRSNGVVLEMLEEVRGSVEGLKRRMDGMEGAR